MITYDELKLDDMKALMAMVNVFGARYQSDPADPRNVEVMELYVNRDRKGNVVARDNDELVGAFLYDMTPMFAPGNVHARADFLVVRPDYSRLGIGKELLRRGWDQAADRGAEIFFHKTSVPVMLDFFRRQPDMEERGIYFFKDLTRNSNGETK